MPVVPRKRPAAVPGLARHAALNILRGTIRSGPEVAAFEAAIAGRLPGAHVRAVGSGRLALLLVLDALDVPPPATILMASYNASCVPNVLQAAGYRLHFVDVTPDTLHLDPEQLPDEVEGAGAVLVTHIEGNPGPVAQVQAWASGSRSGGRGIAVIEDAAHALGARLNDRPVGTLADAAIFSLGRGKHLNTLGGGLAVVNSSGGPARRLDAAVARLPPPPSRELLRDVIVEGVIEAGTAPAIFGALAMPAMRLARRFGRDPMTSLFEDDKSALAAIPAPMRRRLSNLQARFGLDALPDFDAAVRQRRIHADALREALGDIVELQQPTPGADPAWLELTALVDDRAAFQQSLLARGVDTQRTWMDACDALEAFAGASGGPCETARRVGERAVYLPTYAALSERQRDAIIAAVRDAA